MSRSVQERPGRRVAGSRYRARGAPLSSAAARTGLCAALLSLAAPPASRAFVKSSGHLGLEFESIQQRDTKLDMKGEIKLKTKRLKKTRAVVEVKAGYRRMDVRIEDLYIDYKPSDRLKLKIGVSKKILGLEYEHNKQERLTLRRSPIYRKMAALGLVGRQINVRLDVRLLNDDDDGLRFSAAVGGDNSLNVNAQLSLRGFKGGWGYGVWLLAEAHRIEDAHVPVIGDVIAVWYANEHGRMAVEGIHGVDAQRSELNRQFSDGRAVHFMGAKVELAVHLRLATRLIITPLAQASYWTADLRQPEQNAVHLLAGLRAAVGPFRISVNMETIGVTDGTAGNTRLFSEESYYAEVAFFF